MDLGKCSFEHCIKGNKEKLKFMRETNLKKNRRKKLTDLGKSGLPWSQLVDFSKVIAQPWYVISDNESAVFAYVVFYSLDALFK